MEDLERTVKQLKEREVEWKEKHFKLQQENQHLNKVLEEEVPTSLAEAKRKATQRKQTINELRA